MSAPISFVPKKAMPLDRKRFQIIGADETLEIARHTMTLLPTPPFPADAVIHDAACGLGPVTVNILATAPPPTIKIHATDIAPPVINVYNQSAEARQWPCRAEIMDAQKLTFPDASFSHVFLSFGLPLMDDPVAAASEMYRDAQAGGHRRHGLLAAQPAERVRHQGLPGDPRPGRPAQDRAQPRAR